VLTDFLLAIVLGDMDCDGDVDFDDINDFVLGLSDPVEYENQYGMLPDVKGDTDGDGDLDFDDIDDFVAILNAPDSSGLQAVPEPAAAGLLSVGVSILAVWLRFWGTFRCKPPALRRLASAHFAPARTSPRS
jgi:hypothetical protein